MSTKDGAFENSVIAALDTCANRRAPRAAGKDDGTLAHTIGRMVAIIEDASDKLEADDFSAVEAALASQALALDVIFDQFARRSAGEGLFHGPMMIALRAQSQCCATLTNLIALKKRQALKNSRKRTIENGKAPG